MTPGDQSASDVPDAAADLECALLHLRAHRRQARGLPLVAWQLATPCEPLTAVGARWLEHAAGHLAQRLETVLRGAPAATSTPWRDVALTALHHLRLAAKALERAAEAMRAKGMPADARRAHEQLIVALDAITVLTERSPHAGDVAPELYDPRLPASESGRPV